MAVRNLDLSYLDSAALRKQYLEPQNHLAMKFHVQGVKCGRCAQKIESVLNDFPELQAVRFNMGNQQLRIALKNSESSFAKVVQAIEKKGFQLTPIESSQDLDALNRADDKRDLIRLGVAAACASNIMMFSFANYFGATGEIQSFFNALSFLLYLPVVTYVAQPFYSGFIQSLKDGRLSVDGPMAVASLGGFLVSTYNLFRGEGSIYFDSISGFLFLIILSRFFQKRLQRKFLSYQGTMPIESLSRARKIQGNNVVWVPAAEVQVGDLLLVKENEIVPVDGLVRSPSIRLNTAYLNGEAQALQRFSGASIFAGSILKSAEAHIEVQVVPLKTSFTKLVKQVLDQEISGKKSKVKNISDLWAQILLGSVFFIAIAFLLLNWNSNPTMALERALALIILACPCAMAFGTPLAFSFAMRNAFKKGFLVKSPDVFEKILQVKNVVFDKTGTLTGRSLRITRVMPRELSSEQINIILSLENVSESIYADSFRKYFELKKTSILEMCEVQENEGVGVSGLYQGHFYELKSKDSVSGIFKCIGLFKDGLLEASFYLEESIETSIQQTIRKMKERNLGLYILSGDKKKAVDHVAQVLQIHPENVFSSKSPLEKKVIIDQIPLAMMVGDGVNDALAFQAAHVGVAVQGSVDLALRSSDIYILSPEVARIDEIFSVSEKAINLIRRNLCISLIYNILGGTAALLGFINPFIAALLMPVSSGFILLSTWWGSRQ